MIMNYAAFRFYFMIIPSLVIGIFCGRNERSENAHSNRNLLSLAFDDKGYAESNDSLLIVSTIDGKISTFKYGDGEKLWSIDTQPGNLFSSSLSELQFLLRGQNVQVIPSLDGFLYKFDGKTLEPLPVSAEMLLSTSYRIGDNLNIVGAKEVQSYGINLQNGKLHYVCTAEGCKQFSDVDEFEDTLIIERHSQTVRAVNFRNGDDQWSYSVGEHRITLSRGLKLEIPSTSGKVTTMQKTEFQGVSEEDEKELFSDIKVAMMKGFIGTVDEEREYKWFHKLSSPIVNVWKLDGNSLVSLDLFEAALSSRDKKYKNIPSQSLLLVGAFDKKLYIKQSKKVEVSRYLGSTKHSYSANMSYFMPVYPEMTSESNSTSVTVAYPDYDYENGIFFSENNPDDSNTTHCFAKKYGKLSSLKEHMFSFLVKWKDPFIVFSFIASAFTNIFLYVLWKRLFRRNAAAVSNSVKTDLNSNTKECGEVLQMQTLKNIQSNSVQVVLESPPAPSCFQSRYLSDFDLIECLGRGGYGVVFEVKNKIDCCSYAVKRIKFSQGYASDRILREVKVLAKLDHSGIVRYYTAWLETPPLEWENTYDKDCDFLSDFSQTTESRSNFSMAINPLKPFDESLAGVVDNSFSDAAVKDSSQNSSNSRILFENSDNNSSVRVKKQKVESEDSDIVFQADSGDRVNLARSNSLDQKPAKAVKYLFIQMQLCRRESLKDWLNSNIDERDRIEVLDIFYQIVSAVEYVHEQGLIHRDLKPSNIFFSLDGVVKIGDFGLVSSEHNEEDVVTHERNVPKSSFLKHTDEVGTKLYMSPEMADGLDYNYKVDIFSLGLIFYELLVPFSTQFERIKVLTEIRRCKFPPSFRNSFKDECILASQLLQENPDNRPSAAEIRGDSMFDIIHKRHMERRVKRRTLSGVSKRSSTEEENEA